MDSCVFILISDSFLVAFPHAAVGGIDTAGMLNITMTEITHTRNHSLKSKLTAHRYTHTHTKVQQRFVEVVEIDAYFNLFLPLKQNKLKQFLIHVFQWMVPTIQNSMKPFQVCERTHTEFISLTFNVSF